mmetsp:Transcript_64471/g.104327  ORF Transcript_64471/g.104327 Transcript_64471/m.104327 type:complete len:181 (-) Transcript_64471:173-715(-)
MDRLMDTDPALSLALTQDRMAALTQSPEGRLSYQKVNKRNLRLSSDVEAWLPCEIWNQDNCSTLTDLKSGGSRSILSTTHSECPICMEEFSEGDLISRFLCSHALHFECATTWITSRIRQGQTGTCPMCNFVVVTPVFELVQTTTQVQTLGMSRQLLSCLSRLCRGKASQQRTTNVPTLT